MDNDTVGTLLRSEAPVHNNTCCSEQSEETDPPELRHRCHRPFCYPGDRDTCGGRTHLQRGHVHHWTPVSDRYDSNNTEDCDPFSQTSQTNWLKHVNDSHASCFLFMLSYANSCWLQHLIWCTHLRIILSLVLQDSCQGWTWWRWILWGVRPNRTSSPQSARRSTCCSAASDAAGRETTRRTTSCPSLNEDPDHLWSLTAIRQSEFNPDITRMTLDFKLWIQWFCH